MTRDELTQAGQALYGERWQSALARTLDVSDRTMRRWVAGSSPIPDDVRAETRALLKDRLSAIWNLIRS